MVKFKKQHTPSKFTDRVEYEEDKVLLSFLHFNPKGSPNCLKLHKKVNEALKIICNNNWRSFFNLRRNELGGPELISCNQISISKPLAMKDNCYIVVDCGRKVGRLLGFQEKNILYVVELDKFSKYKH